MVDYEQLGVFYLGRRYDVQQRQASDDLLLYDAKDLTTHAVCVGMTGSGKTGLCLSLLEEAAIDGIPAIAIDPKGDLGNLLLTFPDLQAGDFQPWLEPADATRKGLSLDELAEQTAQRWRDGLTASHQPLDRIARFRDAVDLAIYTPGSNAGLPLSMLRSFQAPPPELIADVDAFRERIQGAVSGLLALLGISADPLQSREHILLAAILDHAWRGGRSLELGQVIREVQQPPFDKLGFLDLESVFPAKDRFALAMSLNNLVASPGFAVWSQGEPLDIQRLLFTPQGKPRLSIISIAHLSDAERMFVVTLVLNEMIAWMRRQSGTSSLRALLYMDEVFGFFPPTANPPSKLPMLTLLKQARAFGLGITLATQNPVDLDYKGLANCGTWFLGRLQTERDKARVLDGLEGASAAAGLAFSRGEMERLLSGLGNRLFLMNNVHENEPVMFETRWALSFLRGPLTRDQIASLMAARRGEPSAAAVSSSSPEAPNPVGSASAAGARPVFPPGVSEVFLARRDPLPADSKLVYRPALLGDSRIHFVQPTQGIDTWRDRLSIVSAIDEGESLWEQPPLADAIEFETEPEPGVSFLPVPSRWSQAKSYTALATALKNHLYRSERLTLWNCPANKQVSRPDESEADFRVRLGHVLREQRDLAMEKLRQKYATKLATLQEQIRKAEQRVEREQAQVGQQMMSTALNVGSALLQALFGRKLTSSTNVSRAATSVRSASRVAKEKQDVQQAGETLDVLKEKLAAVQGELEAELDQLRQRFDPDAIGLVPLILQPKKTDVEVRRVALAWVPTLTG